MRDWGSVAGRAAWLLAYVVGALLGCSDEGDSGSKPEAAAGTGSGGSVAIAGGAGVGSARGGTGGAVSTGGAGGAGGTNPAPDAGDPPDFGRPRPTDAGGVVPDEGAQWWREATWTPVDWAPGTCEISVLDDPTLIEPLQWKPMTLGALVGETPVVPLGHIYEEAPDGTSWTGGTIETGEGVVAVRDPDGEPFMGFKRRGCGFQVVSTERGVCVLFLRVLHEPSAVACGDLLDPNPLVQFEHGGVIEAASDELVLVQGGMAAHQVDIIDVSDDSVIETTVPASGFREVAAHGRDVFAVYSKSESFTSSRGYLFGWDGAEDYIELHDASPMEVVNVQVDGSDVVWTETVLGTGFGTTDIYRAALPVSAGDISPVLVRTTEGRANRYLVLGAGLVVRDAALEFQLELIRIADGVRWRLGWPEPWQAMDYRPFINERSLGFQLFEKGDLDQQWVTFRAKLDDVLALPSD